MAMARSPGQSDFVVVTERTREPEPTGAPDERPSAVVRTGEASALATRWVMGATWVMLIVLALLCIIGPHIPSGE